MSTPDATPSELKPCKCGSTRVLTEWWIGKWYVYCVECGAQFASSTTKAEARRLWNERREKHDD